MDRVVVLVDMDCFYVQVEQRLNPSLKGKPCAVVQYKKWKGGAIIAVGYEARACGVTRNMRGDDAKEKCPEIELVRVPENRGKADLTRYRTAGAEVIEVLAKFGDCVERASIDEAYLDLTQVVEARMNRLEGGCVSPEQLANTFVTGWDKEGQGGTKEWLSTVFDSEDLSLADQRLAVAAVIAEDMRAAVFEETGFRCSAGISHNKVLAKLACGLHKPNKQTVLSLKGVPEFFQTLPIRKMRHLGGKFGAQIMEQLGVEFVGDLTKFSKSELLGHFGEKAGPWLYQLCRGEDYELVSARQLAKSIGCSKNFPGKNSLDTREKVKHWIGEMAAEVVERLIKDRADNKRVARSATVYVRYLANPSPVSSTRACPLSRYDAGKLAADAFTQLQRFNTAPPHQGHWSPPILSMGISAGKFMEEGAPGGQDIGALFSSQVAASQTSRPARCHTQTSSQLEESELQLPSWVHGDKTERNSTAMSRATAGKQVEKKTEQSTDGGTASLFSQVASSRDETRNPDEEDVICVSERTEKKERRNKSKTKPRDIPSFFSPSPSAAVADDNGELMIVGEVKPRKRMKKGSIESFFQKQMEIDAIRQEIGSAIVEGNGQADVMVTGFDKPKQGFFANFKRNMKIFFQNHDGAGKKQRPQRQGLAAESASTSVDDATTTKSRSLDQQVGCCDSEPADSLPANSSRDAFPVTDESEQEIKKSHALEDETPQKGREDRPMQANLENHVISTSKYVISADKAKGSTERGGETSKDSDLYSHDGDINTVEETDDEDVPGAVDDAEEVVSARNANERGSSTTVGAGETLGLSESASLREGHDQEDYVECDECGKMVSLWEVPEHSDYHVALSLQRTVSPQRAPSSLQQTLGSSGNGAKRRLASSSAQRGGKKSRLDKSNMSLLNFFEKK